MPSGFYAKGMAFFIVQYVYADNSDTARDQLRGDHRAYMRGLFEHHRLLASGPWVDGQDGALLVLPADSIEQVEQALDLDPFNVAGLVASRSIRQWDPVVGVFA